MVILFVLLPVVLVIYYILSAVCYMLFLRFNLGLIF